MYKEFGEWERRIEDVFLLYNRFQYLTCTSYKTLEVFAVTLVPNRYMDRISR